MNYRGAEKLFYLVAIPSILTYGGYAIYKKNFLEFETRGLHVRKVEEKYLPDNRGNMVKLQNFKQKVFAIGLVDDILADTSELKKNSEKLREFQLLISKNAAVIRDFIKEIQPEEVVLELCDERFDEELRDILNHPNFD